MFLGCPELAWRRKMASHFSYLTLRQSSTNPKNIDARFSQSLMRTNGGASIATTYTMAKLADNKTAWERHWRVLLLRHPRYARPVAAILADNKTAWERHWRVLLFATRATRDLWRQNLPITKLRFVILERM